MKATVLRCVQLGTLVLATAGTLSALGAEIQSQAGPSMAQPRMAHYSVSLPDGRVALIGGHTSGFVSMNTLEVLSVDGSALTEYTMPSPFDGGAVVRLRDGRILMAGGAANLGVAPGYSTTAFFDPETNAVAAGPSLVNPRMNCYGVQLAGGRVLVVGGWYDPTSAAWPEISDLGLSSFSSTGSLNVPRSSPLVLPMNDGRAVVMGGSQLYGNAYYEDVEVYDPETNAFTVLRSTLVPDESGWMVFSAQKVAQDLLLPDGRYAFLIQKQVGQTWVPAVGIFDPADGSVTRREIPEEAIGQDAVFWVLVRGETLYLLLGRNHNSGANTHFRLVRMRADSATFESSNTLSIESYYLGNATPAILGDRIFVAGGTTSVGYSFNFEPVADTFFLPAEPLEITPHYNGWLYLQHPYAYSWSMGRWIFLWGDVLITDLATGETYFLAP